MQEFSSISVSQYEAGSLAGQLTEQSRDGWSVVSIVSTGSTVTAYLSREASADASAPPDMPAETSADEVTPESTPEPAAEPTSEPAAAAMPDIAPAPAEESSGWATSTDITPTAAEPSLPSSSAGVTPEPAAAAPAAETPAAAATAGGAPAGWYADPSSRFELRYWDGGQWTEHVSRAGQQYTDPPVA